MTRSNLSNHPTCSAKTFLFCKLLSMSLLAGWLPTFCALTVLRLDFYCYVRSLSSVRYTTVCLLSVMVFLLQLLLATLVSSLILILLSLTRFLLPLVPRGCLPYPWFTGGRALCLAATRVDLSLRFWVRLPKWSDLLVKIKMCKFRDRYTCCALHCILSCF